MKTRLFRPTRKYDMVDYWKWTSSRGVWVIFKDGVKTKSEYTLSELLAIERPYEVGSLEEVIHNGI